MQFRWQPPTANFDPQQADRGDPLGGRPSGLSVPRAVQIANDSFATCLIDQGTGARFGRFVSFRAGTLLRSSAPMKVLMPLVRLGSLVACLASLVATSAGCEHHDRVVVRERPVIVRQRPAYVTVYARPQPVVV